MAKGFIVDGACDDFTDERIGHVVPPLVLSGRAVNWKVTAMLLRGDVGRLRLRRMARPGRSWAVMKL
jgi:hypothetical protein